MAILVISYSRVDRKQVRALASLLKGSLPGVDRAVYWDDQFEAGEPWFEQLKKNIDASSQLFVFWCGHSSTSQEVRREFEYALEQKKRVVPVLLDDTPLAPELAPIAGIDLRGAVQHMNVAASVTMPAGSRAGFRYGALSAAAAVVLVAGAAAWFMFRAGGPSTMDETTLGSTAAVPAAAGSPAASAATPAVVALPTVSVVIAMPPARAGLPAVLSAESRTEIDKMFTQVESESDVRIRIAVREPGPGRGTPAATAQYDAIKRYIATRHNVPLDRIEIDQVDASAVAARGSGGSITISVQAPSVPSLVNSARAGGAAPAPPISLPSLAPPSHPAVLPVILALAAIGVLAAVVIVVRTRRQRQSIVREFERYWVGGAE